MKKLLILSVLTLSGCATITPRCEGLTIEQCQAQQLIDLHKSQILMQAGQNLMNQGGWHYPGSIQ